MEITISRDYRSAVISGAGSRIEGFENIGRSVFSGDLVDAHGKLVESRMENREIVGVLHFNGRNKFQANNKGRARYLFEPISNHYPQFLVASKPFTNNQLAVIKFLNWPDKESRPFGRIVKLIGPVGDLAAESEARLHYRQLYYNPVKLRGVSLGVVRESRGGAEGGRFNPIEYFQSLVHRDCQAILDNIYSVDPPGCMDIDDAFSWEILKSGSVRVGIHIADVEHYMAHFALTDKIESYSSIYLPHRVQHMLPEIISTNMASLLPGQPRLTVSLWIEIDSLSGTVLASSFEKTIISTKAALTYDQADEMLLNNTDWQSFKKCVELIRVGQGLEIGNSHELVERLMITANHLAAKKLYDMNKTEAIYRIHTGTIRENDLNDSTAKEVGLRTFIDRLQSKSAVYTQNPDNYFHTGLNLHYYTHFTSPIRRMVDINTHQLLVGSGDAFTLNVAEINEFNTRVKRLDRDTDRLKLVSVIDDLGGMIVAQGYLIDSRLGSEVKEEQGICHNDRLYLYLSDDIDTMIDWKPLNDIVGNQISMMVNEGNIIFENKLTGHVLQFQKYVKIQVTLFSHINATRFSSKLTVKLPGLDEFICSGILEKIHIHRDGDEY